MLTAACMSSPVICGTAGGAVAFWVRITQQYGTSAGIISSQKNPPSYSYSDTTSSLVKTPGDGRVVVGRTSTNEDNHYGGVDVDELPFFNRRLSDQDVQTISNMI